MADRLARILGTEDDRINCPFYWKIGACRHGDHCSRTHYRPAVSTTILLKHFYKNSPVMLAVAEGQDVDDEVADAAQQEFEAYYVKLWKSFEELGELDQLLCCDNIGDHMIGNVYVKYATEDGAAKAMKHLVTTKQNAAPVLAEFSPVHDFRQCRCKQFMEGRCQRGGYCNFVHLKHLPRVLRRRLVKEMYEKHAEYTVNRHQPIQFMERERSEEGRGGFRRARRDEPERCGGRGAKRSRSNPADRH